MKYRMLILLMALCLLSVPGRTEELKDYYSLFQAAKEAGDEGAMAQIRADMPQRLRPFRDSETGLWGYIDFLGEWAIQPQFDNADDFRGDYALAWESSDDEDDEHCHAGIIDRNGNWVPEPYYFVDSGFDGWYYGGLNLGYYQIWERVGDKFGFFDVPSGCFSGAVCDDELTFWNGFRLAPVCLNGRQCYVDRPTGEAALYLSEGMMTNPLSRADSEFVDGFAIVYRDDGRETGDWFDEMPEAFIINERGEALDLSGIVFSGEEAELYGRITLNDRECLQKKSLT